tara:strand:+ start:65 stop:763 length:699 start_codon:yes stop_codon:yes gene_type:complete
MIDIILPKIRSEFEFRENRLYTFLNPYSYLVARNNLDIVKPMDIIYADGIVLSFLFSFFRIKKINRNSFDMTSVAKIVFKLSEEKKYSLVIVGTKPNVIDNAIKNILQKYNLNIIGYRDGFFKTEEEKKNYQNHIAELNPDIIIVGMGVVRQESFLIEMREKGWKKTGFTCGGFLHQSAETMQYYPKFINKLHLRWLYRIFKEPKLIKRYTVDYLNFLLKFFYDYFKWERKK